MMTKPVITTIRIPFELWKALKLLQLEGKIKSIQQAAIEALELAVRKEREL
jgi:hypothetical protein